MKYRNVAKSRLIYVILIISLTLLFNIIENENFFLIFSIINFSIKFYSILESILIMKKYYHNYFIVCLYWLLIFALSYPILLKKITLTFER